jgi:hypothetical protein
VRPAAVFGGSCEAAFGAGSLEGVTSAEVGGPSWISAENIAFESARGLLCITPGGKGTFVDFAIIPASAVDAVTERLECKSGGLEWGPKLACFVETEVNGIRLSGVVAFRKGTTADNTAKARALVEGFEAAAASATPTSAPIAADGAWAFPTDCLALDALIDEKTLFVNPTIKPSHGRGGTDVFTPPAIVELAGGYEEPVTTCSWHSSKDVTDKQKKAGALNWFVVDVVGGGAWAIDGISAQPEMTEITIPGVDRAFINVEEGFTPYYSIYVADGPNYLETSGTGGDGTELYPGITATIAALDSVG